jgi:hypothetical protein
MALGLLCGFAGSSPSQTIDDEPVERTGPAPATAAFRPASRPARPPSTQLTASNRPPSEPTSRPVAFDITPSSVTLRLKGARADELFGALSKQSGGAEFELTPDLWPDAVPTVGRVEIVNQPFWPALRELFRLTGTRLATPPTSLAAVKDTGVIWIAPHRGGGGDQALTGVVSGPILVNTVSLTRTAKVDMADPAQVHRTATLVLQLLVEPKLNAVPLEPGVWIEHAEDDRGRAVTGQVWPPARRNAATTQSSVRTFDGVGQLRVAIRMTLPAVDAQRIAKLKGVAEFAVLTRGVDIEIPDVLDVGGTAMRLPGGLNVLIDEVTRRGGHLRFRFAAWNDGTMDRANWELIRRGFPGWARRLRLDSKDGAVYRPRGSWTFAGAQQADAVEFRMSLPVPGADVGGRYRLLWTAPAEAKVLAVPFELTDLPLP